MYTNNKRRGIDMILDKLENKDLYLNINSNLKKAFEFLENANIGKLADGRYEIDCDNVYAFVQSYTTRNSEDNKWESHKRYLDIQYILDGNETILWSPIDQLIVEEEYYAEKDITFYKDNSYSTKLNLKKNYYCILFPTDGHKPCCIFDKPTEIKKIVVKIKL
jgi:YhcH/YjgK/YiaL family protein